MSTPFLGEMRWFSFSFPPSGWAFCNGQTMAINQNQALFSLLGTIYGGNGISTFGLPGLQGRVPMHFGGGITQGQTGGEASHTLTLGEMAAHSHPANAVGSTGNSSVPSGNLWAGSAIGDILYSAAAPDSAMIAGTIGSGGGGQAHQNLQPYLVMNFCIALQGIFPSRN